MKLAIVFEQILKGSSNPCTVLYMTLLFRVFFGAGIYSATSKISKNKFQGHIGKHLEPEEETFSKLKIGY